MLGTRQPYVALCCLAVADMHVQPSGSEWWSPLEGELKTKWQERQPLYIIIFCLKGSSRRIR